MSDYFIHQTDSHKLHVNEIVAFEESSVLICRQSEAAEDTYELERREITDLRWAQIKNAFLWYNLLFGPIVSALGIGWFVGFFMGEIPVIFHFVAGAMVLGGFVAMSKCFDKRAYFYTDTDETLTVTGMTSEDKEFVENWCRSKGLA